MFSLKTETTHILKVPLNTPKSFLVPSPEITMVITLVSTSFYTLTYKFTLLEVGTFVS